ncbi:MAG: tRNA uridine-5-carboxymethylaminomethyl(34) synthesis GTPase MnmE [Defluviitaleaceae bacterium]|nr:tRNA uridine-5-carboxymethylaminomethyl(34) synthesis GTPase MnmE [Defluviitaleaceae bacterium]
MIFGQNENIAAVATPPGAGGIGIIRISGKDAEKILSKIFICNNKTWPSHIMRYGHVYDHLNGRLLDEAMAVFMKAPRSYTAEDVAEIYCHGGSVVLRGVLEAVYRAGARPAEPGEFSKRAFLNGRIDLCQAEAVASLINAKTEFGRSVSLNVIDGALSDTVKTFRNNILEWLASIALSVDYPEHEDEAKNLRQIYTEGTLLLEKIKKLAATAAAGSALTEGVRATLAGRANVGKSSLLNAMLREERAIVTEIPGTTRDVLTESVIINGVPFILSDTAGIRDSEDAIEKLGVLKTRGNIKKSSLIFFVADASEPFTEDDRALAEEICMLKQNDGKRVVFLLNKIDIGNRSDFVSNCPLVSEFDAVFEVSAKNGTGLDAFYKKISDMYLEGLSATGDAVIFNARQRYLIDSAAGKLGNALDQIDAGMTEDLVSIELDAAYRFLGEIIGEETGEDVIDKIFENFCLGK